MANATAVPIVNAYPYGSDEAFRRLTYDGVILVEPGNYPAGGIPIIWNAMLSAPGGGKVNLDTNLTLPAFAAVSGVAGLYGYNVQGLANNNVSPGNTSGLPAYCSNVALTSNVCTVTSPNNFQANQQVTLNQFTGATFLNGQTVTVLSTGLSAAQFEFNFTNANYSSTADSGIALPAPPSQPYPLIAITAFSITSNVVSFTTTFNDLVAGQQVALSGFSVGTYFNGVVVTVSATGLTNTLFEASFTHANVSSTTDNGTANLQTSFLHINPMGVTNTASTATAFAITSNVATITATNTFVAGETVVLQGWSTATYFNGALVTILATGLSGSAYEFNLVHANVGSTSDTGTATRTDIIAGAAVPLAVTNDTINFHVEFARS